MPVINEIVYKDIPLKFNAHPVTGDVVTVKNVDAVKQSVKNLVLTNFFERPYNPFLGGNIISQLFENADPITEYNVATNIRTVLDNFEPRAIIDDVIVQSDPDLNVLKATIVFRIRNNINPFTVDVFLERVR